MLTSFWLVRAAVLGANDGLIPTASLMMGIAATQTGSAAVAFTSAAGHFFGAVL